MKQQTLKRIFDNYMVSPYSDNDMPPDWVKPVKNEEKINKQRKRERKKQREAKRRNRSN